MRDQARRIFVQARRSTDGVGDRRSLSPDLLMAMAQEAIRTAHVAVALHQAEVARRTAAIPPSLPAPPPIVGAAP